MPLNDRKYAKMIFFHYTGHFWAVFCRKNACQKFPKKVRLTPNKNGQKWPFLSTFFWIEKRLQMTVNDRKYTKMIFFHYTGYFWAVFF